MPRERLRKAIRDIPDFPKEGIVFKDITPVLKDPALCKEVVESLYVPFAQLKADAVIGIESRGFLFGMLLAQKLNVPFIPVRKAGRLPYKTIACNYDLEYGSAVVEIHADAFGPGASVIIHDDLLATGGTAIAAAELVRLLGGKVAGFSFVVELEELKGRKSLASYPAPVESLICY
jgi:adenine phosphoribosyltransferase